MCNPVLTTSGRCWVKKSPTHHTLVAVLLTLSGLLPLLLALLLLARVMCLQHTNSRALSTLGSMALVYFLRFIFHILNYGLICFYKLFSLVLIVHADLTSGPMNHVELSAQSTDKRRPTVHG